MNRLIKSIQSGSVVAESFKRVRSGYLKELNSLNPLNSEHSNELRMSIEFCNNFLKHFEVIKKG